MARLLKLEGGELLAEELAGALEAGADSAFGDAENGSDFAGVEFVKTGENEGQAEIFGEGVDHGVDDGVVVGCEE
jgi:hypothetical protein